MLSTVKTSFISPRILFLFLLTIVVISYSNSFYSPLVLDDYNSFVEDPKIYVDDFSLESLEKLSQTRFGKARVIPLATFAINHRLSKGSIVQYHLTNIIIHLLGCVAVYLFVKALSQTGIGQKSLLFFSPAYFALAVCSLWALSPLQTNAVTYIVQRMTSLAALFYITSLTFYIYFRSNPDRVQKYLLFVGFIVSAVCAFMSKENSYMLPATVLLLECMFISPGCAGRIIRATKWYHWVLILTVLIVIYPLLTKPWQKIVAGFDGRHFTLSERLFTELRIVVYYVTLIILPFPGRLNLEHDFSVSSSLFSPISTFASLLIILGMLFFGFYCRKRQPLFSFGIFWFFMNLLIESSFVSLELFFEHRLYLPAVGFFVAILAGSDFLLVRFSSSGDGEKRKIVFLTILIMISFSSILTTIRNNDWRDDISIYRDSYEKSPNKPRAISNYALALGRAGKYKDAIELEEKAIAVGREKYEEYINAGNNIMVCLLRQDKYKEAITRGERLFREMPKVVNAMSYAKLCANMGTAYQMEGLYKEALELYIRGLEHFPKTEYLYIDVARLFSSVKNNDRAKEELQWSGAEVDVFLKLAHIASVLRQYDRASMYLSKASGIDPTGKDVLKSRRELDEILTKNQDQLRKTDIHNDLVYEGNLQFRLILKMAGFILSSYSPLAGDCAGWLLRKAEQIAPGNPFVSVLTVDWLLKNEKLDKALEVAESLIRRDQDFIPLLEVVGEVYRRQKQFDKVRIIYQHILELYPGHENWYSYVEFIKKNR